MVDADLRLGDMREELAAMPADSIDAIVTDPPYELGFMGKAWDSTGVAFDPDTWRAALRVLKPGGHLLAFGGTRTVHRIAVAIEDAGFEIRDMLTWNFGTGFPKSLNLPGGYGTALKPAMEPICMARKPLTGTVAANVQEWGTGAINVDGCRVGAEGLHEVTQGKGTHGTDGWRMGRSTYSVPTGRWPANVILDPEAAAMLDFQVGAEVSRFHYVPKPNRRERDIGCESLPARTGAELTDRQPDTAGLDNPRAGAGRTSGGRNTHATVKPVDLMRYLCRLVCPPGGVVLDPFAGSGTTGIAAVLEGLSFVGVELRPEAAKIAGLRIAAAERGDLYIDRRTDKVEHREPPDPAQGELFT